jgi:hypothetical protein
LNFEHTPILVYGIWSNVGSNYCQQGVCDRQSRSLQVQVHLCNTLSCLLAFQRAHGCWAQKQCILARPSAQQVVHRQHGMLSASLRLLSVSDSGLSATNSMFFSVRSDHAAEVVVGGRSQRGWSGPGVGCGDHLLHVCE